MPDTINATIDTPAALGLAAAVKEFDTPVNADQQDTPFADFLKEFDAPTPAAETTPPATEKPTITPPTSETPPVEGEDEFGDTPPGKGSEAAKKGWTELKKTRDILRTERDEKIAELKARDTELEDLRKKVAELPELSERAKFAEEAERELAVARVEGTREYKASIEKPLIAIEASAKEIAEANDLKVDDLLDVLSERDPAKRREALRNVLAVMDDVDKPTFNQMVLDTQHLLNKRDEIRENAFNARKELEERTRQDETKAQEKNRKAYESAVDHSFSELKKRIPFVALEDGETADGVFDSALTKTRTIDFDKAPAETKAFAAAAGVLLPRITKQNVYLQEKVKQLEARIAEGNAGRPSVNGAGTQAPVIRPPTSDDFMTGISKTLGVRPQMSAIDSLNSQV